MSLHRLLLRFFGIAAPAGASAALSEGEMAHPLARFYEQKHIPARAVLNSLNAIPAAQTISVADFAEAAVQADLLPNGYHRFPDGTGYIHAFAAQDGLTGEMLAWLLPWLCEGRAVRCKLTYPGFHIHAERIADKDENNFCNMRCTLSIGADLDGAPVAPVRLGFRFFRPELYEKGGVFPGIIKAGPFTAGCFTFVLTPHALHVFVWLGHGVSPLLRGYTSEKKLYDAARHCAHLTAHLAGVLPELYAYCNA